MPHMVGGNGSPAKLETRHMKITTDINVSTGELTIEGHSTALGVRCVIFHRGRAAAQNRAYAEMHGWKQRLVDMAAVERSEDGKLIPVEVRDATQWKNVLDGIAFYEDATNVNWSMRPEGAGEGMGLLLKAMLRAGAEEQAACALIKTSDRKTLNAMLVSEKLAVHVAAIRAELGKGVDVSGALEALGI